MPMDLVVVQKHLPSFDKLKCVISHTRTTTPDPTLEKLTDTFNINDLATVRLHFDLSTGFKCKIKALNHVKANHCKVKVKVSCEDTDVPFYAEWICADEWKMIGRRQFPNIRFEEVMTNALNIHISASEVKESFVMKFYNDVDFTDFNLSTSEGSVAVHRGYLAAHSDVFRAMLSREWKEKTEGQVQIQGVTLKTLQHLKDYMYLRTLPDEGLEPLLLLASYYLIDDLKEECVSKLTMNCESGEWRSLLDFATDNKISELICGLILVNPVLSENKVQKQDKD